MRISDWGSDVCSSDLGRSTGTRGTGSRNIGVTPRGGVIGSTAKQAHSLPARQQPRSPRVGRQRQEITDERPRCRRPGGGPRPEVTDRSEEHTSELQSLMRLSYAAFCLKKKKQHHNQKSTDHHTLTDN